MSDNQQLTNILKTILQAGTGSGNPIHVTMLKELVENLKKFKETLGIKGKNMNAMETFVDSCQEIASEERLKEVGMEYSHIIERILENAPEKKYDNAPWRNTFAIDGNTGRMHQCVPHTVYQEMMKIEKEPEEQKRHYQGAEKFYHMLLDTHNLLMNEDRIIRSLEVPTGSEADSYTDKDGKRVMVPPATIGDKSGYPAEISIDQCGAQKTPEQCYLRRDEKGEQACLYMPHLAHLDPPLKGDAKTAWETLKTSACVDKRVVPFKMRNATGVDEKALRDQKKLKHDPEVYTIGRELKNEDVSETPFVSETENTMEKHVSDFCKNVNCQFDSYKAETAFNANQGNLVPVFFDKQGNSTYMKGLYDEYSLKNGVYGERVAEMQATMRRFAQKVADGRGRSKYPDRIKAKLDKAYKRHKEQMDAVKKSESYKSFEKKQKELGVTIRYDVIEKNIKKGFYGQAVDPSKFVPYNDIVAREVYEFAKELAQKKTIRENKAAIKKLLELSMDDKERPLLETTEQGECQAVLDKLVGDFYKINDGQGYIPVLSSRKPISVKEQKGENEARKLRGDIIPDNKISLREYIGEGSAEFENKKPEDWKAPKKTTGNEEHFDAPARRHAITLAEMPEPLANKMFIVLSGGGDPSLYNNFGEYVGLQKGKPLLRGGEGETNKCLFRLSRIAIMLLKGAAKGGGFDTMAAMFKEIFKQKSKEVADDKTKGDKKRKERLFRVTQDEETLMEIMLYPQEMLTSAKWAKARSPLEYKKQLVRYLLEPGGPYHYNTKKWMRSHAMDASKLTKTERKLDGLFTDTIGMAVREQIDTKSAAEWGKFLKYAIPTLIMDTESTKINFLKIGGFKSATIATNTVYQQFQNLIGAAESKDDQMRAAFDRQHTTIENATKTTMWDKIQSYAQSANQTLDAGNWLWLMAKGAKAKVWKELTEEEKQTWDETIDLMKGNKAIQDALAKREADVKAAQQAAVEAYEALGGAAKAFANARKALLSKEYDTFTIENPNTKDEEKKKSDVKVNGKDLIQYVSKKSMHELCMLKLMHWDTLNLQIDTARRVVDVMFDGKTKYDLAKDHGIDILKETVNPKDQRLKSFRDSYGNNYHEVGGENMAAFRNPGMTLEQFRKKMEESEFEATDNIGSALDFIESQRESLRAWSGKHQKLLEMWRQYVGAVPEKNLGARKIK